MKEKAQYNYFMKVPNTEDGRHLIHLMKLFLNEDSYKFRLRGTGLDKMKAPEGYRRPQAHVPLKYAAEIRIYLHAKTDDFFDINGAKDRVIGIDTWKRLVQERGW